MRTTSNTESTMSSTAQCLTTLILLLRCIELALQEASEDRRDLARTLVKRDGHLILLQTNNANELIFNRFIREGAAPARKAVQPLF